MHNYNKPTLLNYLKSGLEINYLCFQLLLYASNKILFDLKKLVFLSG